MKAAVTTGNLREMTLQDVPTPEVQPGMAQRAFDALWSGENIVSLLQP